MRMIAGAVTLVASALFGLVTAITREPQVIVPGLASVLTFIVGLTALFKGISRENKEDLVQMHNALRQPPATGH